jgi:hypothetical protein
MVSSVGYGTAAAPSTHRASVSGDPSLEAAQAVSGGETGGARKESKQDNAAAVTKPGVSVSISPEGAAAASRAQRVDTAATADADTTDTDTSDTADIDISDATGTTDTAPSKVSPVKAFAYGALGLERPDQPHDEQNSFYTAGKWLAAGLTIGGLISLLA